MKIKLSGAKKIKSLLEQIRLGEFWMKAHYADIGIVNMTRQRLIALQRWLSEINNDTRKDANQSNKMRTYRLFKTIDNYKCEDYLHQNKRHRIALTKLRLSNHKLAIEIGRYPRPFTKPAGNISPIWKIDNNFIDFFFHMKISAPKQSIQWQMKQSKKLSKKDRNNNYRILS